MTAPMRMICALLAGSAVLAACAHAGEPPLAVAGAADPLAEAAAALAAAEIAPTAAERTPFLRQVEALRLTPVEDDAEGAALLARWKAEAPPAPQDAVYRGRTLGPAYRRASIQPGETIEIEQIFYAGERAEIAAQSTGGQPVDLEIRTQRDAATPPVCAAKLEPVGKCRWLPLFTARFKMKLVNRGGKPASVYIVFR